MKSALEKWLAPEEDNEDSIISEPAVGFDNDEPKLKFNVDTSNVKKNKSDQFDSLFEEKPSGTHDLPWKD